MAIYNGGAIEGLNISFPHQNISIKDQASSQSLLTSGSSVDFIDFLAMTANTVIEQTYKEDQIPQVSSPFFHDVALVNEAGDFMTAIMMSQQDSQQLSSPLLSDIALAKEDGDLPSTIVLFQQDSQEKMEREEITREIEDNSPQLSSPLLSVIALAKEDGDLPSTIVLFQQNFQEGMTKKGMAREKTTKEVDANSPQLSSPLDDLPSAIVWHQDDLSLTPPQTHQVAQVIPFVSDIEEAKTPTVSKIQFISEDFNIKPIAQMPVPKDTILSEKPIQVMVKNLKGSSTASQERQSLGVSKLSTSMLQVLQQQEDVVSDVTSDVTGEKIPALIKMSKEESMPALASFSSSLSQIESPEMKESVMKSVEVTHMTFTPKGKDTLEIQLYPEHLGKVDVKLSLDHGSGRLQAIISPEHLEGYHALLKEHVYLQKSLAEHLSHDSLSRVDIKVNEPQPVQSGFSHNSENFSSTTQFSNQQQKRQEDQKYNFFLEAQNEYLVSSVSLNENRRLDLAV